jgi:hypothetical protein
VTFNITVTASPSHLTIGSTTGSKITVQAANAQDGTPPPNLTPVTLTTTLGEFNSVGSGLQLVNLQLVGGRAQAVLFPGTSAGTATVGATSPCGTSSAPAVCPSPSVFTPGATSVSIGSPGTFFVNSLSPNTGDPAGGLVVTISGGGFLAPVAVSFGSSSAPVKSVSPNAIQVITPPSATPVPVGTTLQVNVTVTNNIGGTLGGTATLTNAFTYVPGGGGIQQPQVFSVNPASGTNDGGTQITIIGQGFVAPVQVFFGSGAASNFNGIEATIQSVTATQIIVVSPPARGFGQDNTNQLVSILVKNTGSGFATVDSAAFKYGSKVLITSLAPTTTVFNQPVKVTVFGQGFADPVAVSLAGIAAQVLSTSGTEIQVLSSIPNVSTCSNITGPVHVANINNGDTADGPTFVYLVPKPEVFNVCALQSPSQCNGACNAPQGPQGGGTVLKISGSFADPGGDQILLGQQAAFPASGCPSTTSMLFVTTPQFGGTFPTQPCIGKCGVTGTMNIGASVSLTVNDAVTSCTTTIQGAFTFEPDDVSCHVTTTPPQAAFTATPMKGNNTVILNNTSSGGSCPPLSFAWDFGGATDIGRTSNMKMPMPTYTNPGTYLITLTVTDSIGQTSSVSQTVTVPAPP